MAYRVGVQGKRYFASVILSFVGIAAALFLAVTTSKISIRTAAGAGLLFLLIILVAHYILTYGPLLSYSDRKLSTFFSDYLRMVEREMEDVAEGDVSFRANVMRPMGEGILSDPVLKIAYYTDESEYDDEEFELEFEEGQGAVGAAYESGDQMFCISPEHVRTWDDSWETTVRQDRVTEHLNTIIATPIFRPSEDGDEDDRKPKAVLILDSEEDLSEILGLGSHQELQDVRFKETELSDEALDYARNMGILL